LQHIVQVWPHDIHHGTLLIEHATAGSGVYVNSQNPARAKSGNKRQEMKPGMKARRLEMNQPRHPAIISETKERKKRGVGKGMKVSSRKTVIRSILKWWCESSGQWTLHIGQFGLTNLKYFFLCIFEQELPLNYITPWRVGVWSRQCLLPNGLGRGWRSGTDV